MKAIIGVLKQKKILLLYYILLGVVINSLNLVSISYFQEIIDTYPKGLLSWRNIVIYSLLLIVPTILAYFDNYPHQHLFEGLYLDFKLLSIDKISRIDYSNYQKYGVGQLIQKIEEGALALRNSITNFWLTIIRELVPNVFLSLFLIYNLEKRLLFYILTGYIFVALTTTFLLKKLYSIKENILIDQELFNKKLVRGLMEMVLFRLNNRYKSESRILSRNASSITNARTKLTMIHELFFTIFGLIINLLKIVVLVYAIFEAKLSVGSIVVIVTLLGKAYEPVAIFNVIYVDYKLNKLSIQRYLDFLDCRDDTHIYYGKSYDLQNDDIRISELAFSYNKRNHLFEDFNLTIKKNCTTAFVGSSGSGKSTIIKIILGLIKPNSGEIFFGNVKLSELKLEYLYKQISYLPQESPIFDGTLRENIVLNKEICDEDIINVLKKVELLDFYTKLELGLDTELGEKGIVVSGGERQRISLARLYFDNSELIILDEATSALDNITEQKVMNRLLGEFKNKTIIIIAHRLESIKGVDRIIVFNNGKVCESGSFEELLNLRGDFYKLYKSNIK
ncbi:ABC transporter ATP-binding protein [Streptococcus uberis]|uniref:ABC transporter ATP-binding protein n=1 Tax=Streptococcus uberis TaxID=1349 RepID=UPI0012B6589D|nr:ABC transporter ATP-binding protein [Streptococcus uberis]MTB47957.1 ATP-binding cassette domain-containing protein [Streptococcus uberis]